MSTKTPPTYNLTNIIFFSSLLLVTCVGLPWYIMTRGLSAVEWGLFLAFSAATGLSITVGYHRLFAHRAFEAHPIVSLLSLIFGAAAFEQSALMWASMHRDHHKYVDTDRDPYNIKAGFWFAHIIWMLKHREHPDYSNVKDLQRIPLMAHQHKHYVLWAISFGVLLPMLIGTLAGYPLGTFLFVVVGRLTLVHHSTFSINSICHTFGKATYDLNATARDHWLVALLTNGEGFHNFHHKFSSDYRNGLKWYHWDPSKWIIAALSWCGLATRLSRTPNVTILAAKMAADRQRVEHAIRHHAGGEANTLQAAIGDVYTKLRNALHEWNQCEHEYKRVRRLVSDTSRAYLQSLRQQLQQRREEFLAIQQEWVLLINTHPLIPRAAHVT